MAYITISDNGAAIKIDTTGQVRNLVKWQICDVVIVKTTVIKIDIGQGALQNVFINYAEVTSPSTANIAALRDQIVSWVGSGLGGGGSVSIAGVATEGKQDDQITRQNSGLSKLDAGNTYLSNIYNILNDLTYSVQILYDPMNRIDVKTPGEPLRVDESTSGTVYKGFAALGTADSEPLWAIQKITTSSGITSYQWAGGDKNFMFVWSARAALTYS